MYIAIDLSSKDSIHVMLFNEESTVSVSEKGRNRETLACVEQLLKQESVVPDDIHGIAVVIGVGSFTSTRIATTIANSWTFVKHIPICAITPDQMNDHALLAKKMASKKNESYISATYSGQPHIG
jgi:tRNA A37 threonylcarbamoyladenosine modification protein TsaB